MKEKFVIFGNPVAHSKSPQMQNAGLKHINFDGNYEKHHLENGNEIKEVFLKNNYKGANITVPHKEFAYENADGQAIVFSENPDEAMTDELLFEIAQLFPQYIICLEQDQLTMATHDFGEFDEVIALDELTTKSENESYIKITALNIADGLAQYDKLVNHSISQRKMVQFSHRTFSLYIQKVGLK